MKLRLTTTLFSGVFCSVKLSRIGKLAAGDVNVLAVTRGIFPEVGGGRIDMPWLQVGIDPLTVVSIFNMDQLGKIRRDHWKERVKISKIAKFEIVSLAAVFSIVTQRSSSSLWGGALRDETKNGCEGD